jgi:hypothetical protein
MLRWTWKPVPLCSSLLEARPSLQLPQKHHRERERERERESFYLPLAMAFTDYGKKKKTTRFSSLTGIVLINEVSKMPPTTI